MRVIATAGHVDHGKSTLVRALTGRDPDRLAEEKRRGVTIELGFAWTEVPPVGTVAFVDVPGHERFIPTMLAGAGPVAAALLVVAADEGWMPQSAEHLEILRLLDVRHGVVALTRADLVDVETAEVAAALVAEELVGTGLSDAPIVAVSAVTGDGLPALREALADVLGRAPAAADRGRPRLWVDRSFTIRGAGTVVTGTLTGGAVEVGDLLHVHPADRPGRVRGLQALEQAVDRAEPGWRVAVNLAGIDVAHVPRGSVVARADQWHPSTAAEIWCTPAPGRTIGPRGAWKVHVGTAAVPAGVRPVRGRPLESAGPVRIELAAPLLLAAGDRVVLRDAGPGGTAGGGVVLDPDPPARPRGAAQRADVTGTLAEMAAATGSADRLAALVERRGHAPTGRALALADASTADVEAAGLVDAGGMLLSRERWRLLGDLVVQAVVGVHQRRPAITAVDRADARRLAESAGAPTEVAAAVLAAVVAGGRLEAVPGGVRIPGHQARLSVAQQSLRTRLLGALATAGLEGLSDAEVAAVLEDDHDLLDALAREGEVLPADGRVLGRDAVEAAVEALRALQARSGPFTAAEARDALAATRRVVIPLLEVTDARGLTVRDGDLRQVAAPLG